MALYLNLYHETQKQKLKRQRDPFKLAVMGALVVAALMVAWYFYRVETVRTLKARAEGVAQDLKKYDPKALQAQADYNTYDQHIKLAQAMTHKMENRFYWAPLLEQLIQVVPPEIQITGLDASVSSDGSKKVTLTVTGIATGGEPRAKAEELRIAVQNNLGAKYRQATAVFKSLEDGTEPVSYQGKASPTVLFVIDVGFTSPDVDDESKAKPATRHPKP